MSRERGKKVNSWRGTPSSHGGESSPAFAHMRRSSTNSTSSRRSSTGSYYNRRDSYQNRYNKRTPPVSPFPSQDQQQEQQIQQQQQQQQQHEDNMFSVTSLIDSLPRVTETISIPIASVGCVMGPQGSIMKELRRQSGALIVLQQRSDMRPDQLRRGLTLTGTIEQITLAKRLIAQCVSKDVRDVETTRAFISTR